MHCLNISISLFVLPAIMWSEGWNLKSLSFLKYILEVVILNQLYTPVLLSLDRWLFLIRSITGPNSGKDSSDLVLIDSCDCEAINPFKVLRNCSDGGFLSDCFFFNFGSWFVLLITIFTSLLIPLILERSSFAQQLTITSPYFK